MVNRYPPQKKHKEIISQEEYNIFLGEWSDSKFFEEEEEGEYLILNFIQEEEEIIAIYNNGAHFEIRFTTKYVIKK